jgi:hypothetical protein
LGELRASGIARFLPAAAARSASVRGGELTPKASLSCGKQDDFTGKRNSADCRGMRGRAAAKHKRKKGVSGEKTR